MSSQTRPQVMQKTLSKSVRLIPLLAMLVVTLVAIGMQSNLSYASDNSATNQAITSPKWQEYSQGVATWMWFDVYQATLFVDANSILDSSSGAKLNRLSSQQLLSESRSLKLQLCYAREVTPEQFIEGANHVLPVKLKPDIRKQVDALHNAYQTVEKGDCYSLIYNNQTRITQLKLNDKLVFSTDLKGFKQVYFGIWIGDNPLSSSLKNALLNAS
ncbi:chalcone isomerase family protein [Thiomicrorhabdus sp.]|uniref:chalcone isomerase family protein n=1 Tax=Thiomicrorhabdus sp. TaxID=2039724 RepID=UPI002AA7E695|nr:chalcone isomerase family protein [Thiomicrorhabdus sp.]